MEGLAKISNCDDPGRSADVIFVHGLDGDCSSTWRRGDDGASFWPKWLGDDYPQVGIWSFGYAVSSTAWKGHSMPLSDRAKFALDQFDLKRIGKRPVMFVCHSLGGLLVKQALRAASESRDPGWKKLIEQTRVLLFLSTPHSGADIASWLKYLSVLLRATVALGELEAHHPQLRELNEWYRDNSGALNIKTFVYCEKLPTLGILVVNETTADPGIPGVRPIPLLENHIDICKPTTRESPVYERTRRLLEDCLLNPR